MAGRCGANAATPGAFPVPSWLITRRSQCHVRFLKPQSHHIDLVAFSAELLGGLGPQAENDLAVIGAVRGSLLAGDRLMLDANQAWDVDGTMDGALYDPGFEPGATKA